MLPGEHKSHSGKYIPKYHEETNQTNEAQTMQI